MSAKFDQLGSSTTLDERRAEAVRRVRTVIETGATVLDLGDLALDSLPSELEAATSLRHLALGRSSLIQTKSYIKRTWQHERTAPQLSSLQPVAALVNLHELDISGCNNVDDISPLSDLKHLTYLSLHDCSKISDLSCITGLQHLTDLILSHTPAVSDLAPLAGLKQLTTVRLGWLPALSDLTPLAGLARLDKLFLPGCPTVSDLTPLAGLARLTTLRLDECTSVADLSPLAELKQLADLDLHGCPQLSDLTPLADLTQLTDLSLEDCFQISDLSPLAKLHQLKMLFLNGCSEVSNLQPLARLVRLKKLGLGGCSSVSDLSPLAGLARLEDLNLAKCTLVSDLSPLAGLTTLEELILSWCPAAADLSPLSGLERLVTLRMDWCPGVSDLSPLARLTRLTRLYLHECTGLSDLSPLLPLAGLQQLVVRGSGVPLPDSLRDSTNAQEILAWWRAEGAESLGRRPLLEVKLLIVGQGRVGKSHLRERLFHDRRLDYYEAASRPTHSFDAVEETFDVLPPGDPPVGKKSVSVRAWDFGGQAELHSSHRFFLGTQRCFYLLVLAADRPPNGDGPDSNRLNYWLRLIAHYGTRPPTGEDSKPARAPVLIVVTRCDMPTANLAAIRSAIEDARQADFFGASVLPAVTGVSPGSDGANTLPVIEGFGWSRKADPSVWGRHAAAGEAIRAAITQNLAVVPDLWTEVIEEYHTGRQFLADTFANGIKDRPMSRAYLTGDTLAGFTEQFRGKAGITNDDELIAFRNLCLRMLQHLGVVHWVAELVPTTEDAQPGGVRDTAFNPEWVKWPVYDLLWLDRSACPRPGVVPTDTINDVLGPHPAYTKGEDLYRQLPFGHSDRRRVLELLKECKLAFDDVARAGLLIPDLLDTVAVAAAPPAGAWEYRAPFLPERVFLRFVAEVHRTLTGADDRCHRNRVVMTLAGHRVVIEARYSPPGHAWPSLSIRSESTAALPEAVARAFRDTIERLFADEGFDPADYPWELVGVRRPAGTDGYVFECHEQLPAGKGTEPEYDFTIVYNGRDLAAALGKTGRYRWKKQTGLHQLWLLIRSAGKLVHVNDLDRDAAPQPDRFARPDAGPSSAPVIADPQLRKLYALDLKTLKILMDKQQKNLNRLIARRKETSHEYDANREAEIKAALAAKNQLQEVIESKDKPALEDATNRVRMTLQAAIREFKARMKACGFTDAEASLFDDCWRTAKKPGRPTKPYHFAYTPRPGVEWRATD